MKFMKRWRRPWPQALGALAMLALFATPSSADPTLTRFDALPRAAELLPSPVRMGHCGLTIVEWRASQAMLAETSLGEKALSVIDAACATAFDRYADFLRSKGLRRSQLQPSALPAVSLLPGNVLLDGKAPRALNDMASRFQAVAPGCCYWGLYVDSINHVFLRNDPLVRNEAGALEANPRFVRTLTHEISHVLSAHLGVWSLLGYDAQRDEELAEAFVAYMGMVDAPESSSDDIAFHRVGTDSAI